jgi:dihydropteroate synthase
MGNFATLDLTRCGNMEFKWGERTYVMGVINISPDSFSGDGLGGDFEAIVRQAKCFVTGGADILDIGGESTRPGSTPISATEELHRVIPVIERLAGEVPVPLSMLLQNDNVRVNCKMILSPMVVG